VLRAFGEQFFFKVRRTIDRLASNLGVAVLRGQDSKPVERSDQRLSDKLRVKRG
jgi:hypothetical protein